MKLMSAIFACCVALVFVGLSPLSQAEEPDADAVQAVVDLLGDQDKEMRALGLQQVREELKGPAATKQLAALLPKLPPAVQVEMLSALADRGDKAARPAVLEAVKSSDAGVRIAAILAIGALGEPADVAMMTQRMTSGPAGEQAAAKKCLLRMCGDGFNPAIVAILKDAQPGVRVALIGLLAERRAADSVPAVLALVDGSDAETRKAAMKMLGSLAKTEHVARMVAGVLKAEPGAERDTAEKAVLAVCNRTKDPEKRAEPVLAVLDLYGDEDRIVLLSTLGRIGGSKALKIVEAAIADSSERRHEAGIRAICNWPDASVSQKLLALAKTPTPESHRHLALLALTRVASVADSRTSAERLELLKTAMSLAKNAEERNYVLKRSCTKPVRSVESLRFALPYLGDPECAQEACATVVELAHHRDLREPNKAEFLKALDRVLAICKDADLRDRAERYKAGKTRLLPTK